MKPKEKLAWSDWCRISACSPGLQLNLVRVHSDHASFSCYDLCINKNICDFKSAKKKVSLIIYSTLDNLRTRLYSFFLFGLPSLVLSISSLFVFISFDFCKALSMNESRTKLLHSDVIFVLKQNKDRFKILIISLISISCHQSNCVQSTTGWSFKPLNTCELYCNFGDSWSYCVIFS